MIGATRQLSRASCVPVLLSILIMSVVAGGCRPGSNGVAAPESGAPPTGAAEEETAVGPETAEPSAPSPEDETAGVEEMVSVPAAGEAPDPWMTKPVLPVLMLTVNAEYKADVARLAQDVELTESEIDALRKIAIREAEVGNTLRRESDRILFDEEASEEAKRQSVASYNSGIVQMMAETDREVRDLLGKRYAAFRRSIREWWAIERARARARREG